MNVKNTTLQFEVPARLRGQVVEYALVTLRRNHKQIIRVADSSDGSLYYYWAKGQPTTHPALRLDERLTAEQLAAFGLAELEPKK